ncbi:small subunit ribosomal protein S12 [Cryptococcus neoformans Bt120]|nr:small subunit ribosomal protein S12 [Cryptococcus neoformans var. grubii Bt120]
MKKSEHTGIELAPVSIATLCASSITSSACSFFQKQTNPVPLDRPVALSMVILAYRKGPKERKRALSSSSVVSKGRLRMKRVLPTSTVGRVGLTGSSSSSTSFSSALLLSSEPLAMEVPSSSLDDPSLLSSSDPSPDSELDSDSDPESDSESEPSFFSSPLVASCHFSLLNAQSTATTRPSPSRPFLIGLPLMPSIAFSASCRARNQTNAKPRARGGGGGLVGSDDGGSLEGSVGRSME